MSEEVTCINAATLTRVLKDCSLDAEIGMVIGDIPLYIPINSIKVGRNVEDKEVISLLIKKEDMQNILYKGLQITEENDEPLRMC